MGCWIIFLLLFCCNNQKTWNDCGNSCNCSCNRRDERNRSTERREENCEDRREERREERRDSGPVWTRTNYTNGDTCGCEDK